MKNGLVLFAVLLGSCTRPSPDVVVAADNPPRDQPLLVDSIEYVLRPREDGLLMTSIGISFVNPLPDTIYQPNCRRQLEMTIERLDETGRWRPYWAPTMLRCLSGPIVIAPGESYRDSLPVYGWLRERNIAPEFDPRPDAASSYRLVWHQLVLHYNENGRPFGEPVPPFHSNSFRLRIDG